MRRRRRSGRTRWSGRDRRAGWRHRRAHHQRVQQPRVRLHRIHPCRQRAEARLQRAQPGKHGRQRVGQVAHRCRLYSQLVAQVGNSQRLSCKLGRHLRSQTAQQHCRRDVCNRAWRRIERGRRRRGRARQQIETNLTNVASAVVEHPSRGSYSISMVAVQPDGVPPVIAGAACNCCRLETRKSEASK
jgi:hypothetical protein